MIGQHTVKGRTIIMNNNQKGKEGGKHHEISRCTGVLTEGPNQPLSRADPSGAASAASACPAANLREMPLS